MSNRLAVLLVLVTSVANGQVYLIAGSPMFGSSERFGASLFQVLDDGSVQSVAKLVPDTGTDEPGLASVLLSYDLGIAFIDSNTGNVLDLHKGAVVKSCRPSTGPANSTWLYHWLLNIPAKGAVLVDEFYNSAEHRSVLVGTILDPAVECDNSRIVLEAADLVHVALSGRILIADAGDADYSGLYFSLDLSDGSIKGVRNRLQFPYGYRVPSEQLVGLKAPQLAMLVNNSEVMVLTVSESGADMRALVIRKKDGTCHRLPLPNVQSMNASVSFLPPIIRGFGHFIAMAEQQPRANRAILSAGNSEWRKASGKMGPNSDFLFRNAKVVFPGRLHLYDASTERMYTVVTNQGDSEILLVEHNTIYYRSSDRLYAVGISETGLGHPKLLASDEAIRDVHWAFIKH